MKTNHVLICLLAVATATPAVHSQNYVYATGNPSFSTQIPIENVWRQLLFPVALTRHFCY
jgi:hypothetical protein